jgi:hypothetical protein
VTGASREVVGAALKFLKVTMGLYRLYQSKGMFKKTGISI